MSKDVFVMRAPQPEPQLEWSRWLRATETELAPTPLLLFVRDRFDAMEALLRHIEWSASGHNAFTDALWNCCPVCDGVAPDIRGKRAPKDFSRGHGADCSLSELLAEIDAAKEKSRGG